MQDLPTAVRKIAEFAGIELTEEQIQAVVQQNQFETRVKNATQYQQAFLRQG